MEQIQKTISLFFFLISALTITSLLLVKFDTEAMMMLPQSLVSEIKASNIVVLNNIFLLFFTSLSLSIFFAGFNARTNKEICNFFDKFIFTRSASITKIIPNRYFIFLLSITGAIMFILFENHTSIEWPSTGEIPGVLRLLDSNSLNYDFYTENLIKSPKIIFLYIFVFFESIGISWYQVLYFLKCFSYICTPILLYIYFDLVAGKWVNLNRDPNDINLIKGVNFFAAIGFVSILQSIERLSPFGWTSIQFFSGVDPMRLSFLFGLAYLVVSAGNNTKWIISSIFIFISILIHPAVGICIYIIHLLFNNRIIKLNFKLNDLITLILGIITPIVVLLISFDNSSITSELFFEIYILNRHPHHYLISELINVFSLFWIFLFIIPIFIAFKLENNLIKRLTILIFVLIIFSITIQFVFSEIFPNKLIMKLGPSRFTSFFSIIFSLEIMIIFSYILQSKKSYRFSFLIKIAEIFSSFICFLANSISYHLRKLANLGIIIFAIILSTYLFTFNNLESSISDSETEILNWISENTDKDSVFLTKKFNSGLIRIYSNRSIYGDWMMPFSENAFVEFNERLDIFKKYNANTLMKNNECNLIYKNIDYLIAPKTNISTVKEIYSNNEWSLVSPKKYFKECSKND